MLINKQIEKIEELPEKTQIAILVTYYAVSIGLYVASRLYVRYKVNQNINRMMETRRQIEAYNKMVYDLAKKEGTEEDLRFYIV